MTDHAMLEVSDLAVEFPTQRGPVHAVNGVSFAVANGEMLGIVGESGCGKSATMRSLIGLLAPPGRVTGGSVRLEGEELIGMRGRELRRIRGAKIGFISQSPFGALNPVLSIEQQFANIVRAHSSTPRREIRELALERLRGVGIAGPERVLRGYAHELSGGMAQRVVIAMAMIHGPRLLLADEPTTALDVTVQRQILDLMVGLLRSDGRSMILVTHDLGVVAQYCDRVVVMYAGKVVETGPVAEVFTAPAHHYTRALLDAVPRVGRPLGGLRGRVPDLVNYPVGCPYGERCGAATEQCSGEPPALRSLSPQIGVSCHHPLEQEAHDGVAVGS